MNDRQEILSIHYLRGLAALLIVLLHTSWYMGDNWGRFFGAGDIGVDIFFIISGFIIAYATRKKPEGTVSFLGKRITRIYPCLFVVWVFYCLYIFHDVGFTSAIKSLLLFHKDYSSAAPAYGFNLMGTPWTLTYEIYFYIVFAIAMRISFKYRSLLCSIILITLTVFSQKFFNGTFDFSRYASANIIIEHWYQIPIKIISTTISWEFIAGMFLFEIRGLLVKFRSELLEKGLILLSITYITMLYITGNHNMIVNSTVFCGAFLIFVTALYYEAGNEVHKSKVLHFLGNISYSMYLIHYAINEYVRKHADWIWSDVPGVMKVLALLILTFVFSYLSYTLIELPAMNAFKRLSRRNKRNDVNVTI